MKRAGCPECKIITELHEHQKKWNGRQVYKCTKCGTLLLECWGCERMAKVGVVWDDAYCDQCAPKVLRNALGFAASVAVAVITGGKYIKKN